MQVILIIKYNWERCMKIERIIHLKIIVFIKWITWCESEGVIVIRLIMKK